MALDCILIGYNELPFTDYEKSIRRLGVHTEAYRDLKLNFIDVDGHKLRYVDLLNHVYQQVDPHIPPFQSGAIPNLAAAYLTNYLNKHHLTARYINLFQDEKQQLIELLAQNPVCVAITTTFYFINEPVNDIVSFIRQHQPTVKIIVGGPLIANHVRNFQGETLKHILADMQADYYVIESQGEATLTKLVGCLKEKGDPHTVPNLLYMAGETLVQTAREFENNSLDANYIDWQQLGQVNELGHTLQTRTARSCAFSCSFCGYPSRAGKLTLASLETVKAELDIMRNLGVQQVVFIDDTFNVPIKRFKELCRLMIAEGYTFDWFSYFRCSNADEEAITLAAESGCKGVFLGIESGSPKILKIMNKAATVEKYLRGIHLLQQHNILTFGSFIIGFPGETLETIQETIHFITASNLDYYRTQLWYCEPGTPIQQHREKYQIQGNGFQWQHATMTSMEAIEHIDRIFLTIDSATWLPQWYFDFWIIPYFLGRGVSLPQFQELMELSHELLQMEFATYTPREKQMKQRRLMAEMVDCVEEYMMVKDTL